MLSVLYNVQYNAWSIAVNIRQGALRVLGVLCTVQCLALAVQAKVTLTTQRTRVGCGGVGWGGGGLMKSSI
jgi:hypothetical protein